MWLFNLFNSGNERVIDIAEKTSILLQTISNQAKLNTSMDYKLSEDEIDKVIKGYNITIESTLKMAKEEFRDILINQHTIKSEEEILILKEMWQEFNMWVSIPNLAFFIVCSIIKKPWIGEPIWEHTKEDIDIWIKKVFPDFY